MVAMLRVEVEEVGPVLSAEAHCGAEAHGVKAAVEEGQEAESVWGSALQIHL